MSGTQRSLPLAAIGLAAALGCADAGVDGDSTSPPLYQPPAEPSFGSDLRATSHADAGSSSGALDAGAAGSGAVAYAPCGDVPPGGRCTTERRIDRCVVPTGDALSTRVTEHCGETEYCSIVDGQAQCLQDPALCVPETQRCAGQSELEWCDASGTWQTRQCSGVCRASALGGFCAVAATVEYGATLRYEARRPDPELNDWQETTRLQPARGLLVVSVRDDELVDAVTTDGAGTFSIQVPTPARAGDLVAAMLLRPGEDGSGVAYAVLSPDVPDGESSYLAPAEAASADHWVWEVDPGVSPSGSTLVISEALGSGAVHLFHELGRAYDFVAGRYGRPGRSLAAWFRPNSSWDCGTCFFAQPVSVGGLQFESQMLFPATIQNQSYWADSVTGHEMGHWVMWSYGETPNEGGRHCLGTPTLPGQAWSEGWATGFSAMLRGDSRYWTKQHGSFFWFDLATRTYPGSLPWQRADPAGELHQEMDENEIAAMLWALLSPGSDPGVLLSALAAPSMREPPFARGYTRHSWTVAEDCSRQDVEDLEISAPTFADYLDSLRCQGAAAEAIDEVTEPEAYYPYPSQEVECP